MSHVDFLCKNIQDNTPSTAEIVCRQCGTIDEYRQAPGKGPHHASLICTACGHFIKWLARQRPPLKPTAKQVDFLRALGYRGPVPTSRKETSEQIDALLKAKGVHHG